MTPARLYLYKTLLKRFPRDLQDTAAALGEFIREAHAVMGQRHFTWHRHVTAADQSHIRNGVMRGPKGTGRDQRRALPGEAGHTVEARGLEGFRQGHGGQDGGEAPRQHRRAGPWRAQEEEVVIRTPA